MRGCATTYVFSPKGPPHQNAPPKKQLHALFSEQCIPKWFSGLTLVHLLPDSPPIRGWPQPLPLMFGCASSGGSCDRFCIPHAQRCRGEWKWKAALDLQSCRLLSPISRLRNQGDTIINRDNLSSEMAHLDVLLQ